MTSIFRQHDTHINISDSLSAQLANECLPPIILCIGSDRLTGDCLGPLVGHILSKQMNLNTFVYGNLEMPITALNVENTYKFIKAKHIGQKVIAIDSSIGRTEDIGLIKLMKGGLFPGSADGKNLSIVGDISITAIVTKTCNNLSAALSSVRLGFVYELALRIANGIYHSLNNESGNQKLA